MAKNKRERFLWIITFTAGLALGGTYLYRQVGENWLNLQDTIDQNLDTIERLIQEQTKAGVITQKYDAMEKELKLEGSDSQQQLAINQNITDILKSAGLEGKYRNITYKEPQKEEDFKILSISIDQIECTPKQLGELLYLIEKHSNVMEVEGCQVDNLVSENGTIPYRFRPDEKAPAAREGMLAVNLQIARLVEYRPNEKPKKRNAARSD